MELEINVSLLCIAYHDAKMERLLELGKSIFKEQPKLFLSKFENIFTFYEGLVRYTYILTIQLNLDRTSLEINESDFCFEGDVEP